MLFDDWYAAKVRVLSFVRNSYADTDNVLPSVVTIQHNQGGAQPFELLGLVYIACL